MIRAKAKVGVRFRVSGQRAACSAGSSSTRVNMAASVAGELPGRLGIRWMSTWCGLGSGLGLGLGSGHQVDVDLARARVRARARARVRVRVRGEGIRRVSAL